MIRSTLHLLLLALLFLAACGKEDDPATSAGPQATGALVSIDGCKQFFSAEGGDKSKSCLSWNFDASAKVLELVHENAGFNCCPKAINASITIEGQIITIAESEIGPACDCNCLFDLHMRLDNVTADRYTIRIIEPYRNKEDEELLVPVDLRIQATGSYCVPRFHYPWS